MSIEKHSSPGYALTVVAESTTDVLLSAECAFRPRPLPPKAVADQESNIRITADTDYMPSPPGSPSDHNNAESETAIVALADYLQNDYSFPTPEDLGEQL